MEAAGSFETLENFWLTCHVSKYYYALHVVAVFTSVHGIYNDVPKTASLRYIMFTVYATCNVISPLKYVLYLHISTFHSMCAVPNVAVFLQCLHFVLSRYVVQVSKILLTTRSR